MSEHSHSNQAAGRPLRVSRAAVLGAGVMGAQIAAHLANARIPTLLFDLGKPDARPGELARQAIDRLARLDPAPLALRRHASRIEPADYDHHIERLKDCDLVIEAIAERPDLKATLYAKAAPHLAERAVFATNTSGLPIHLLAQSLPEPLQARFCGMHFFNPPRYLPLVELIAGPATDAALLDALEAFLVTVLGKGVVRAKDSPNFVANRIGMFSLLAAMHHAQRLGLPFDRVDALTGTRIGRPKSATFRTCDVVGLDTVAYVLEASARALRDDPWRACYCLPAWLPPLLEQGALGQKAGRGVYRKEGSGILVLDPATGSYRPSDTSIAPETEQILAERDPARRLAALRDSPHPEAQFLWAIQRDVFHYAAVMLERIADNARDADFALRWGFGWERGPFEIWQDAGWKLVAGWIDEDAQSGKAMAGVPLPDWVHRVDGVHRPGGSYAPGSDSYRPRSGLPVYRRQLVPERLLGEGQPDVGHTLLENRSTRLWCFDDGAAILSLRTKMHTIGSEVLDSVGKAVERAERDFGALVLWNPEPPFSAGANLKEFGMALQTGGIGAVESILERFQQASLGLRYARVPVIAAVRGLVLGGGCEFVLHCDRIVAALETYMGLVEAGIGLLPAGGGCKELARRAAEQALDGDPFAVLRRSFEQVATARVAKSAEEAREAGWLRDGDVVVLNPQEILFVALSQARAMADAGYRPPLPTPIRVAGRSGIATFKGAMVNLLEGGFISAYDFEIGSRIASAVCGGDVDAGMLVDEAWLLRLEREGFLALAANPLTMARVKHMLETGKPLRN